jgi:sugar lactone lactonase YvrE
VGTPDGICVDAKRAVWYADVPNGDWEWMEGGFLIQPGWTRRNGPVRKIHSLVPDANPAEPCSDRT